MAFWEACMKTRMRWGAALAAWAIVGCGEDPEPTDADYTRSVMGEIFEGIRVALPASVDSSVFKAPRNQGEIFAALDTLVRNTALLEEHARGCDSQMSYLARSVERDAIEAKISYTHGHYKRAAFVLRQIVEDCVVCHTRLPDDCGSIIAEGFVDQGVMASLPPEPRSTLLIATRQFDEALDALEEVLTDPLTHPAVMLSPLTEFLVVAIRVNGDYERPISTLQTFAQREDLWPSLREDVGDWIVALPSLQERAAGASTVASARAIIEEGGALDEYGDGQGSLLHFIVASSILERYIDAHPERDAELGEAYYLRGNLETRIGHNYWVTTAPFFLEESIRIAPAEPFAAEALIVLERELFAVYEGSDVEELPDEEEAHLTELRAMIEGS
jgi:hypothetical protein